MKKIKIFVDAHVFDGIYQGTTTYIKGLYNGLVKHDDFQIFLAAEDISKLKVHFKDPRFEFIAIPKGSKFKRLLIDIPKLIKEYQCDYAHFQYITPLFKSCKYINTIHDLLFLSHPSYFPFSYRFTKKNTFKISALKSDLICTVSGYSKDALVRYFKIKPEKIIITPNAVEQKSILEIDITKKYGLKKFILFVSRFEPRKNHYLLLKTFVDLKLYDQYQLVLIGKRNDVETKDFDTYFNGLKENIKSEVLFFENLSEQELYSFYKQAELFIYPSAAEGFGIPPLEAGISATKVLCSNQTAMMDFDFFGDYLFDPNNEDEFKQKVVKVLKDDQYPFERVKNAIITQFDWNIIADDFAREIIKLHQL